MGIFPAVAEREGGMPVSTAVNPVKLLRISVRVFGWDRRWWGWHRHYEYWHHCATPEMESEKGIE